MEKSKCQLWGTNFIKESKCQFCGTNFHERNFKSIYLMECVWKFQYLEEGETIPKKGVNICGPSLDFVKLDCSDEDQKNYSYIFLSVVCLEICTFEWKKLQHNIENQEKEVGAFFYKNPNLK